VGVAKTSTKKAEPTGGNRRDRLASFEAARKKEQRRRTAGLLAICLVLALALLAYPLYLFVKDYQASQQSIGDVGVAVAGAGCAAVEEHAATGNQQHVAEGTKVTYARTPPDSGEHYPTPAPFAKRFYTLEDRPAVETLVHNLEHGYTVVWYRDTLAKDQIDQLSSIAKTFKNENFDPNEKFIAAPWSEDDGAGFPAGKNVVLARWIADPANPADTASQKGVRQACTTVSGPAIRDFMAKYPSTSAPEPNGA
jgi:hypothetical protein